MEQEYQKLEQNLIDLIKEEQMKLGYQKETIRLYYPADPYFGCWEKSFL